MKLNTFTLGKAIILLGIGVWMALAVLNNTTDMGTNLHFMRQMMSMTLLKSDHGLGQGLMWRDISSQSFPVVIMYVVVVIEAIASILLLWASARMFKAAFNDNQTISKAIQQANIALIVFACIWLWFAGGDLWFGFWINKGAFAAMHTLWIMNTIILFVFINYQPLDLSDLKKKECK